MSLYVELTCQRCGRTASDDAAVDGDISVDRAVEQAMELFGWDYDWKTGGSLRLVCDECVARLVGGEGDER